MADFSDVLDLVFGFLVRKFVLLVLGFARNYLSGDAPVSSVFDRSPIPRLSLNPANGISGGSLLSCFFGRVPLLPS